MTPPRDTSAGVTLVEVMVALVLFALIGAAGFSVLDQVIRAQDQTEGRLQRLAAVQRTMLIVSRDFLAATGRSLSFADGAVSFRRSAGDGEMAVRYDLEDATLVRQVSSDGVAANQALLPGVGAINWGFLGVHGGWSGNWPPDGLLDAPPNPAAVALDLTLTVPGPTGVLRQIAVLPADPGQ